jgi:hypothetical protein
MYISNLVGAYPSIHEVWLFGSRANGSAGLGSDWDYMVFANESTLERLRSDVRFHDAGIDLMIVTDGDQFAAAWSEGSRVKRGRLGEVGGGWHWVRLSRTTAMYRATKRPKADGLEVQVSQQYACTHKAMMLHRRNCGAIPAPKGIARDGLRFARAKPQMFG